MANIEALNELIRVVRETPDHEFDMSRWACGSVGCALGRAAMDSWFNDRGLKLDILSGRSLPEYNGKYGAFAGAIILGLSLQEADRLFDPLKYKWHGWSHQYGSKIERQLVIARIQHLIDHYTLDRDHHVRAYRSVKLVNKMIEQAMSVEQPEMVN